MLNNIAIGTGVTLDLQTRILARTDNEDAVTLPQSACLCLAALVDAQGDVLSQEQLMEIGWRSAGVEVTENSVRVMITKLRRAFVQLEVQETITLVAVTRSGYRLIVREASQEPPLPTPAPVPEPTPTEINIAPAVSPPVHAPEAEAEPAVEPLSIASAPPLSRKRTWKAATLVVAAGLLTGLVIAIALRHVFFFSPLELNFVRWNGPGIPPGAEVMVQEDQQNKQTLIEATLHTYTQHVLNRRTEEKSAPVLYVTTGSEKMSRFQGLIACQQRFKDSGNDCESFYFRLD